MTYYNTNKEEGEVLEQSKGKTTKQEEVVLSIFVRYPTVHFRPEDVWNLAFKKTVPLTSVRRAISNLTSEGLLTKTDVMKEGGYGKSVHTWILTTAKPKENTTQMKLWQYD